MNTLEEVWDDRKKIFELISVSGEVQDYEEVYRLLVKGKHENPATHYNTLDLDEIVRFSPEEGVVANHLYALRDFGLIEQIGRDGPFRATEFGKKYFKQAPLNANTKNSHQ